MPSRVWQAYQPALGRSAITPLVDLPPIPDRQAEQPASEGTRRDLGDPPPEDDLSPVPVADSHVAMSNASVARAMQAAPPIGGAPRLDPKRMLLTGQDADGNASVAGFAQQTMPPAGPAIRSGPPP